MTIKIKTGSWFDVFPEDHVRIGISRGSPRRMAAGYRLYKALAPGPWFNSVDAAEYYRLYREEVLGKLDPQKVARDIEAMAAPFTAVLLCFERPDGRSWCHRSMAAEWLGEALGLAIPEFGHEHPRNEHPLWPAELPRG